MRYPNPTLFLILCGILALPACGVDAAHQAELDAQLVRRLALAEATATGGAGARQILTTIQREHSAARFKMQGAGERLRRRGGGILTGFSGGLGNFWGAQAEKRMAQTHESRARAAEKNLRDLIARSARKALGDSDYERAIELRNRPSTKSAGKAAKRVPQRKARPTSRPSSR